MIFGLIAAGLGITGGILQGVGQRRQLEEATELRKIEARMAQRAAMDAYRRGSMEAGVQRQATSRLIGEQTLLGGASGLDMGSSAISAAGTTTRFFGELDAATIEENAIREAFGMLKQSDILIRQAHSLRTERDWAVPMGILSGLTFGAGALAGTGIEGLFVGGPSSEVPRVEFGGGGGGPRLNLGNFADRLRLRTF